MIPDAPDKAAPIVTPVGSTNADAPETTNVPADALILKPVALTITPVPVTGTVKFPKFDVIETLVTFAKTSIFSFHANEPQVFLPNLHRLYQNPFHYRLQSHSETVI